MKTFGDRVKMISSALDEGPGGLTIADWVARAGVSYKVVQPSYRSRVSDENQKALAWAAADLLSWDPTAMERWLVYGQENEDIEAFLRRLPQMGRCVECNDWFAKTEIIRALCRCRACVRKQNLENNPVASQYNALARAKAAEIARKDPELAQAIEEALQDESRSLTYKRVATIMARHGKPPGVRAVRARMAAYGLEKPRKRSMGEHAALLIFFFVTATAIGAPRVAFASSSQNGSSAMS